MDDTERLKATIANIWRVANGSNDTGATLELIRKEIINVWDILHPPSPDEIATPDSPAREKGIAKEAA